MGKGENLKRIVVIVMEAPRLGFMRCFELLDNAHEVISLHKGQTLFLAGVGVDKKMIYLYPRKF